MKVLLYTFGTRGDVQPFVALGVALKQRGHEVTLCTGKGYDWLIEAYGLTPATVSIDYRAIIKTPVAIEAFRSISGRFKALREFKGVIRTQFDEMWTVAQEVRPDVIVYHPRGFAAQHIAEALQAVAIPSTLQPAFVPTGAFPNPLTPLPDMGWLGNRLSHDLIDRVTRWAQSSLIGKWRESKLGLTSKGQVNFFEGYDPQGRLRQRLHAYSRYLAPPPDDWTERERVTGYWFLNRAEQFQPPPSLEAFLAAGPPPAYVGFGSMPAANVKRQTRMVIEGLRRAKMRGVLASGWGGLDAVPADDIYSLESVPHDWLFQRCAVVVHHGGAGTTHEGLRWSRPTIVCPMGIDQPYWGRMVHALGAGPKMVPLRSLTPGGLAKALEQAKSWSIVSRAAEIGTAIGQEKGAEDAAEMIDTLSF
ncbi:glycosyltransferase [Methyloligella sp. 2.7D]|uniref:glycosyltransferase n=1 Tax=unclassified Methyloligella TaxID=2625955 RepID=UPI00157BBC59|nr:glycosyltransferase [Methyloligella sp. GL2]QKP76799.1 glycosyltransferase family 1 protein [Methyloligella sp. GL2]